VEREVGLHRRMLARDGRRSHFEDGATGRDGAAGKGSRRRHPAAVHPCESFWRRESLAHREERDARRSRRIVLLALEIVRDDEDDVAERAAWADVPSVNEARAGILRADDKLLDDRESRDRHDEIGALVARLGERRKSNFALGRVRSDRSTKEDGQKVGSEWRIVGVLVAKGGARRAAAGVGSEG
jgi:hypothetical protein